MTLNLKMWKDILTEKVGEDKLYSQARVYLLFSIIAYYVTLGIITAKSIKPNITIEIEYLKVIIDALQWAILLFAGYSFGNKGIEAIKTILGKNPNTPDTLTQNTNQPTNAA